MVRLENTEVAHLVDFEHLDLLLADVLPHKRVYPSAHRPIVLSTSLVTVEAYSSVQERRGEEVEELRCRGEGGET